MAATKKAQIYGLRGKDGAKGEKGDPGGVAYVFFTVENGHLYANVQEENSGLNFAITNDGRLEVTYE